MISCLLKRIFLSRNIEHYLVPTSKNAYHTKLLLCYTFNAKLIKMCGFTRDFKFIWKEQSSEVSIANFVAY